MGWSGMKGNTWIVLGKDEILGGGVGRGRGKRKGNPKGKGDPVKQNAFVKSRGPDGGGGNAIPLYLQ